MIFRVLEIGRVLLLFLSVSGVVGLLLVAPAFSVDPRSLPAAGSATVKYATNIVKPALSSCNNEDKLSLFLGISNILTHPEKGISVNKLDPTDFYIYNMLDKVKLGFLYALKFPPEKKQILRAWNEQFMQKNRADVFFAPSAEEIIRKRAAFGCTHYARAFIAVVKALDLVKNSEDLRYVISCKADDYNQAMEKKDRRKTINGHQFVLTRIGSKWIAINTTKGESTAMPEGFSPDSCVPPLNIPVKFESYHGVVLLIRKIGRDYNDDCGDNSLTALMNISRSGDSQNPDFLWERFVSEK